MDVGGSSKLGDAQQHGEGWAADLLTREALGGQGAYHGWQPASITA